MVPFSHLITQPWALPRTHCVRLPFPKGTDACISGQTACLEYQSHLTFALSPWGCCYDAFRPEMGMESVISRCSSHPFWLYPCQQGKASATSRGLPGHWKQVWHLWSRQNNRFLLPCCACSDKVQGCLAGTFGQPQWHLLNILLSYFPSLDFLLLSLPLSFFSLVLFQINNPPLIIFSLLVPVFLHP